MQAIERIFVGNITVPESRRPVDAGAVNTIAASMARIGLKTPITVWGDEHEVTLIAGAHRLAAAKQLGWDMIDCFIMDCSEDDAEMWEISENLHRAELSVIQRAEQIGRWVELSNRISAQLAQKVQQGRPEGGVSKASRDLNIDRDEVRRAVKIATLTPEAKQAAVTRGLDDNQSALLAAAVVSPERQVEAIHNFADSKLRAAIERANPPEFKEWSEMEAKQYRALVAAWNNASPRVREKFEEDRDVPVMDRRAS